MKTLLMNRYFDNGSYHSGYTKIICQIQLAHRRNTLVLLIIIISNSGIQRTVSHRRNIVFNSSAQNPVWVDGHWLATDGTARSGKYPPRGGWDLTTTNPRDWVADCLFSSLEFWAYSLEASESFYPTVGERMESLPNAVFWL